MRTILTTALLLCLLCHHWQHARQERIKDYIQSHIGEGTDTDCMEALEDAKVMFDMSESEVKEWERSLYL